MNSTHWPLIIHRRKRALYHYKQLYIVAKEPRIAAKEPYIAVQVPNNPPIESHYAAKEPCMTPKSPVLPQKSYILSYKKPYKETICDIKFPTAIGHPLYFAPPKSPTSPQQSSVSSPKSPTTLQNSPILLQNSPISRERALGCSPYVTLIVA